MARHRRHRRRLRVCHLRQQRAEVVPGQAGLAVGLTAAGYGSGTVLTIMPIANMLKTSGYQDTFFLFVASSRRHHPSRGGLPAAAGSGEVVYSASVAQSRRDYTPRRSAAHSGLLRHARHVHLHRYRRSDGCGAARRHRGRSRCEEGGSEPLLLRHGLPSVRADAGPYPQRYFASAVRWISDHIGREKTMFFAFAMEGIGIVARTVRFTQSLGLHHPVRRGLPRLG